MVEVESAAAAVNGRCGNPYLEIEACITKAEEEISRTLCALGKKAKTAGGDAATVNVEERIKTRRATRRNHHHNRHRRSYDSDEEEERGGKDVFKAPHATGGRFKNDKKTAFERTVSAACIDEAERRYASNSNGDKVEAKRKTDENYYYFHHKPKRNSGGGHPISRQVHSMQTLHSKNVDYRKEKERYEYNGDADVDDDDYDVGEKFDRWVTSPCVSSTSSAFGVQNRSYSTAVVDKMEKKENYFDSMSASVNNGKNRLRSEMTFCAPVFSKRRSQSTIEQQQLQQQTSSSAVELLDLSNSESVSRWTSQIFAQLDSIADASSRDVDESPPRAELPAFDVDAFVVPLEAKLKLEEACTELRELKALDQIYVRRSPVTPCRRAIGDDQYQQMEKENSENRTWPLDQGKLQQQQQTDYQRPEKCGTAKYVSNIEKSYCAYSTASRTRNVDLTVFKSNEEASACVNICVVSSERCAETATTTTTGDHVSSTINRMTSIDGDEQQRIRGPVDTISPLTKSNNTSLEEEGFTRRPPRVDESVRFDKDTRRRNVRPTTSSTSTIISTVKTDFIMPKDAFKMDDEKKCTSKRVRNEVNGLRLASPAFSKISAADSTRASTTAQKSVSQVVASIIRQAESQIVSSPTVNNNIINNNNNNMNNNIGEKMDSNTNFFRPQHQQRQEDNFRRREDNEESKNRRNSAEENAMIYMELRDACTQTTPVSLSRSSSFTWMSEAQLDMYSLSTTSLPHFVQQHRRVGEERNFRDFDTDDETCSSNGDAGTMEIEMENGNLEGDINENGRRSLAARALDKSLSLSEISRSTCGGSTDEENLDYERTEKRDVDERSAKTEEQLRTADGLRTSSATMSEEKDDDVNVGRGVARAKENNKFDPGAGECGRRKIEEMQRERLEDGQNEEYMEEVEQAKKLVPAKIIQRHRSLGAPFPNNIIVGEHGSFQEKQCLSRTRKKMTSETKKCIDANDSTPRARTVVDALFPAVFRSANTSERSESEVEESLYDNVPNATAAARQRRKLNLLRDLKRSDFVDSAAGTPDSPPSSADRNRQPQMLRDVSVASGLLADSESSPLCPDRGFPILDGLRSDVATPDSVKSLVSSDGGHCSSTQAAPEFQYKSARDYMMEREVQIRRISTTPANAAAAAAITRRRSTTATTTANFVPKESVLRGETTRFQPSSSASSSPAPSPVGVRCADAFVSALLTTSAVGDLTAFDARSAALANSLPALDRLDGLCGPGPVGGRSEAFAFGPHSPMDAGAGAENSASRFSSRREHAEAEARQCCFWLRAAGFPQYARMYEVGQFPINIENVQKDHEFLDSDSLQALYRRLHSLNRCAIMKLDKKAHQIVASAKGENNESEEDDDEVALSRKWRFVRKSRTWSRIVDDFGGALDSRFSPTDTSTLSPPPPPPPANSAYAHGRFPSRLDDDDGAKSPVRANFVKQPNFQIQHQTQQRHAITRSEQNVVVAHFSHHASKMADFEILSPVQNNGQQQQQLQQRQPHKLQRSQSERIRDKAKAWVRRMEMMKNGRLRRRSPSLRRPDGEPEISNPVLIQHFSAAPPHMRMLDATLAANAQATSSAQQCQGHAVQAKARQSVPGTSSADIRRRGRVFISEERELDATTFAEMKENLADSVFAGNERPSGAGASAWSPSVSVKHYPYEQHHFQKQQQRFSDRNTKRQHPDSESSPETHAKSDTSSSLRVDVDLRGAPLPQASHSSFDSSDAEHSPQCWERRDSGVGSSLSRSPSAPSRPRVRWHSFQRRHGPTGGAGQLEGPLSVDCLTAAQMIAVQKFALLKLTALLEKYSPTQKSSGWSWGVQKLFRRIKPTESKTEKENQIFGVPLHVIAQRTGQPLPQCILQAMRYLRKQAADNVGLFRKSGVRSRIQQLKEQCESSSGLPNFESKQAYDVADMLKQYFRELPEPLLTSKLSETFLAIHLNIPEHLRMEAMQKVVLLLPDENREVLMSLLYFLNDVASHADKNQMNATNLAVCFAPTLFQLSARNVALSPSRRHKTITGSGVPSERELTENRAAHVCLAAMIFHCKKLFTVPQDILMKCAHSGGEFSEPSDLADLGHPYGNYCTYLGGCVDALLKEHRERWRGWVTEGSLDGVEITSKKVSDDHPLKLWRCWVDIEAPPREILQRILRERDLWDDDIIKWRVVRKLADNCDVFQSVVNDMPPHPTRDYCVVRLWHSELHDLRGGCVLVQTSVNVPDAPLLGGVRGICLASRILVEPSGGGKSRLTYIERVDTRGRGKTWYNKVFGYAIAAQISRLRDSFRQLAEGPETKV